MGLNSNVYVVSLACFTFLVLTGVAKAVSRLEDPFASDSLMPNVDDIKLDYEFSSVIQAMEQHYVRAEMMRTERLGGKSQGAAQEEGNSKEASLGQHGDSLSQPLLASC